MNDLRNEAKEAMSSEQAEELYHTICPKCTVSAPV